MFDGTLVAPILEEGMRRRKVILPNGAWFNLWSDTTYTGPNTVDIESPLEQIPVLVRAGSILPMVEEDRLLLHVYPDENAHDHTPPQLLYSDAGDGYGDWRLDSFYLRQEDNFLEISWENEGKYPFPYRQIELHLHGFRAKEVWVDDRATPPVENIIQAPFFRKVLIKA